MSTAQRAQEWATPFNSDLLKVERCVQEIWADLSFCEGMDCCWCHSRHVTGSVFELCTCIIPYFFKQREILSSKHFIQRVSAFLYRKRNKKTATSSWDTDWIFDWRTQDYLVQVIQSSWTFHTSAQSQVFPSDPQGSYSVYLKEQMSPLWTVEQMWERNKCHIRRPVPRSESIIPFFHTLDNIAQYQEFTDALAALWGCTLTQRCDWVQPHRAPGAGAQSAIILYLWRF